jgi:hypothetical protein
VQTSKEKEASVDEGEGNDAEGEPVQWATEPYGELPPLQARPDPLKLH